MVPTSRQIMREGEFVGFWFLGVGRCTKAERLERDRERWAAMRVRLGRLAEDRDLSGGRGIAIWKREKVGLEMRVKCLAIRG